VSVVVLGLSHRSAPIALLEAVALDPARAAALATAVRDGENVNEVMVLATCNRVEVYAVAATFHGAVTEIGEALAAASGVPLAELRTVCAALVLTIPALLQLRGRWVLLRRGAA